MVKKTLLSLAIAATAAGLAGCNTASDSSVDQAAILAGTQNPDTVTPVFNVARQNLPLATDFLFSGSTDGTLVYAAGDVDIFLADGSRNPAYNPVFDAISDLDGFSTSGQIHLKFTGSLSSEVADGSVYLIPMNYVAGEDGKTGPKFGVLDSAAPLNVAGMTGIEAEVISFADADNSDTVLRISPTSPLSNDTRYLVVVTNNLKDSDGEAVKLPGQYEYLIGEDDLLNPALAPARSAMQGWYQLAQGAVAALQPSAEVALAYTFTTGGTVEVQSVMAAPGNGDAALASTVPAALQFYMNTTNDDAPTQIATIEALASVDNATATQIYGGHQLLRALPAPTPRASSFPGSTIAMATILDSSESLFQTGSIELPYYSQAPLGAFTDDDIALNPAAADNYVCTDTADVACLTAKATAANTVVGQWSTDTNVIEDLKVATGTDATEAEAFRAPSENVTNLFPFAKENGKVSVPVLVVEPKPSGTNSCAKPAGGWPVVIYQHGITSNRMATIPLAEQLAQNCFATIAIDLPMHGLMPTDLVTSGVYGGTGTLPMMAAVLESAGGSSVSTFAGFNDDTKALVISGETLKQRHFALTAGADGSTPTAVAGAETDRSGSLYISFLHFQTTRDNNRQAVMDLLNLNASIPFMDIDGNAGTQDFDASKIYFAGISLGSIVGMQFVAVNNTNTVAANANGNIALNRVQSAAFGVPGGGLPKLLEFSNTFGPTIVGALTNPDSFNLTQGGESYESLQYVYQATVDSADPINFGGLMQLSQTPYTLIEAVGDNVIPNSVASAPLAGTDPLINVYAATQIDTDSTFTASQQVYLKLADDFSNHGSLAVPDLDDTTPETAGTFATLATHVISFFSGAGVLDDSLYGGNIIEPVSE
jgi:Pla-1/cef family extracellular lipase